MDLASLCILFSTVSYSILMTAMNYRTPYPFSNIQFRRGILNQYLFIHALPKIHHKFSLTISMFIQGGLTATDVFAVEWMQTGAIHFGMTVSYYGFVSDGNDICFYFQILDLSWYAYLFISYAWTYQMEVIEFELLIVHG